MSLSWSDDVLEITSASLITFHENFSLLKLLVRASTQESLWAQSRLSTMSEFSIKTRHSHHSDFSYSEMWIVEWARNVYHCDWNGFNKIFLEHNKTRILTIFSRLSRCIQSDNKSDSFYISYSSFNTFECCLQNLLTNRCESVSIFQPLPFSVNGNKPLTNARLDDVHVTSNF